MHNCLFYPKKWVNIALKLLFYIGFTRNCVPTYSLNVGIFFKIRWKTSKKTVIPMKYQRFIHKRSYSLGFSSVPSFLYNNFGILAEHREKVKYGRHFTKFVIIEMIGKQLNFAFKVSFVSDHVRYILALRCFVWISSQKPMRVNWKSILSIRNSEEPIFFKDL